MKAKSVAIELLRASGVSGQNALRSVVGLGGAAEMQRTLQQSLDAHQVSKHLVYCICINPIISFSLPICRYLCPLNYISP